MPSMTFEGTSPTGSQCTKPCGTPDINEDEDGDDNFDQLAWESTLPTTAIVAYIQTAREVSQASLDDGSFSNPPEEAFPCDQSGDEYGISSLEGVSARSGLPPLELWDLSLAGTQNARAIPPKVATSPACRDTSLMPSSPPLGKSSENLKALGWVERMLPNEMTYFQHKGLAITTNSNLHGVQDVTNLSSSLSNEATIFRSKFPLLEWELWVPELPLRREKVLLVNHTLCLAMREQTSLEIFSVGDLSNDDRLEMECQYWHYAKTHPAHIELSLQTEETVISTLKWAYGDNLLPDCDSHEGPISPQKSEDILQFIESLGESDSLSDNVVRTRIMCSVLLQIAQWRLKRMRAKSPPMHSQAMYRVKRVFRAFRK